MDHMIPLILALLLGYFLGSIPFGLLLTKITNTGDLRSIGSGNIGATNVLRTGNKGLAALTLVLDLLKGTAAVLLATYLFPGAEPLAAAGAFFGHLYPAWLQFRGGKGVATYAGIMFGLSWESGIIYAAVWILTLAVFRISSLAGLLAAISAPLAMLYFGLGEIFPMLIACSILVFWKHRENIERLVKGTEPRVGSKSK